MSHRIHGLGVAGLITIVAGLVSVGVYVIARDASRSASEAATRVLNVQLAAGCDRNQIQKVYDIVDERTGRKADDRLKIERPDVAAYYISITDCKATYSPSNQRAVVVYLNNKTKECFIGLVVAHHWKPEERPTTDPVELARLCSTV